MRIGVDVRELERGRTTGIHRFLTNFLKGAASRRPSYHYYLFFNQRTEIPFDQENIRKTFIPEYVTAWWDQVQLPVRLKKEKIDVFLSPYPKGPLFSPCPVVLTIHDLITLAYPPYRDTRRMHHFRFKVSAKIMAQRARLIITDSEHSKKDIMELLGIPDAKIKIIPLAVDRTPAPTADPPARRQFLTDKYGIRKKYLLVVGNFKPHKNIPQLLNAFSGLPETLKKEYQLVLVGRRDAHFRDVFEKVIRLNLKEDVISTGHVSDEELDIFYQEAELLLIPSAYEGFGLPALEAMAHGTPVIASNLTSLPEVVGDAALLVNPVHAGDITRAIQEVLGDEDLKSRLAKKGLERSKLFSQERVTEEILAVVEEAARK